MNVRCLVVGLSITASVGFAHGSPSLTSRAEEAAAANDHGQAYAAYRAALYYQIPPSDPAAATTTAKMKAELELFLDARVKAAEADLAAGKIDAAIEGARALLSEDPLEGYRWDHGPDNDKKDAVDRPAIDDDHRASARAILQRAATAGFAEVDAHAAKQHYLAAVNRAQQLVAGLEEDDPLRARLDALRTKGGQAHQQLAASVRDPGALRFHGRARDAFGGAAFGAVAIEAVENWSVAASQTCAELSTAAGRQSTSTGRGDAIQVRVDGDTCAFSDVPRKATRQVAYKDTETREVSSTPTETCSYQQGSTRTVNVYKGDGKFQYESVTTPGQQVCTSGPAKTEFETVEVTKYRDEAFSYTAVTGTWKGTATFTWESGSKTIPFSIEVDVDGAAKDGATAASQHQLAATSLGEKLMAQATGVRAEVRAARAERAYARFKQSTEPAAREDALFEAAAWDRARQPELDAYLVARYGVSLEGFADEGAKTVAGITLPDLEGSEGVPCKTCIARAWYHAPPLPPGSYQWWEGFFVFSHLQTGSYPMGASGTNLAVGLDLRAHKEWGQTRVSSYRVEMGFTSQVGMGLIMRLEPIGVGFVRDRVEGAITAGVGISGYLTGGSYESMPFALELPVEAHLGIMTSPRTILRLHARASWLSGDTRSNGAPDVSFTDEVELGAGLDWVTGELKRRHLGLALDEQVGVRRFGLYYGRGFE